MIEDFALPVVDESMLDDSDGFDYEHFSKIALLRHILEYTDEEPFQYIDSCYITKIYVFMTNFMHLWKRNTGYQEKIQPSCKIPHAHQYQEKCW